MNFHAETSCPERQTLPALTTCNISSCPGKPLASPLRVCAYRRGSLSRGIDAATALLSVLCALCFSSKCEAWQRASPLAAVQQAHQGHCGHLEDGTQHRVPRPTMKTLARRYWKCLHLACVDAQGSPSFTMFDVDQWLFSRRINTEEENRLSWGPWEEPYLYPPLVS